MKKAIFKRKKVGELNKYLIETYINCFMKRYFKDFIYFFFFFFFTVGHLREFFNMTYQ